MCNIWKSNCTLLTLCQVQLWDCGGSPQFESCWPAISRDATALILVARSALSPDEVQFLEMLYLRFGAQHGLKESQCAVFLNNMDGKIGIIKLTSCIFSNFAKEDKGSPP